MYKFLRMFKPKSPALTLGTWQFLKKVIQLKLESSHSLLNYCLVGQKGRGIRRILRGGKLAGCPLIQCSIGTLRVV